jgi:hypothetical protein
MCGAISHWGTSSRCICVFPLTSLCSKVSFRQSADCGAQESLLKKQAHLVPRSPFCAGEGH